VIWVSRPKSPSFSSESEFSGEAQPRETGEEKRHKGTNYKAKDIIGKITNLFCIYLFKIVTFIYIHINNSFIVFFISLPTKL
jgi:Na+/melibiose symporter-like transporter